jgi:hypothetical protein
MKRLSGVQVKREFEEEYDGYDDDRWEEGFFIFVRPITKLSPWSWALFERPSFVQLLKNLPAFYGTLSWARSSQSIPTHPVTLRSILILFTHIHLGLPSNLFPSVFPRVNCMYFSSPQFRGTVVGTCMIFIVRNEVLKLTHLSRQTDKLVWGIQVSGIWATEEMSWAVTLFGQFPGTLAWI